MVDENDKKKATEIHNKFIDFFQKTTDEEGPLVTNLAFLAIVHTYGAADPDHAENLKSVMHAIDLEESMH